MWVIFVLSLRGRGIKGQTIKLEDERKETEEVEGNWE